MITVIEAGVRYIIYFMQKILPWIQFKINAAYKWYHSWDYSSFDSWKSVPIEAIYLFLEHIPYFIALSRSSTSPLMFIIQLPSPCSISSLVRPAISIFTFPSKTNKFLKEIGLSLWREIWHKICSLSKTETNLHFKHSLHMDQCEIIVKTYLES